MSESESERYTEAIVAMKTTTTKTTTIITLASMSAQDRVEYARGIATVANAQDEAQKRLIERRSK